MSAPSDSFFSTFNNPPSFPLIPIARTPRDSTSCTRLLFTFPRTISATSIVSASVTRRPLINCGFIPAFSTHLLISFPPPCTIIGLNPTSFNKVTSSMTRLFRSSSTMALPPYFTTIIFRLNLCIYGSASISTSALLKNFCIFGLIFVFLPLLASVICVNFNVSVCQITSPCRRFCITHLNVSCCCHNRL